MSWTSNDTDRKVEKFTAILRRALKDIFEHRGNSTKLLVADCIRHLKTETSNLHVFRMRHIIGECLERSRSIEGWEQNLSSRCWCKVQENVFEKRNKLTNKRKANRTYVYMGKGIFALK